MDLGFGEALAHLHGSLQSRGLQCRATHLGFGEPLTCLAACSLGAYDLAQRIWEVAKQSLALCTTACGPTVSGSGFWDLVNHLLA